MNASKEISAPLRAHSAQRSAPAQSSRWLIKAPIYIVLALFSVLFLIPFVWLLLSSFKLESQIFSWPPSWIPDPFFPQNYLLMFDLVPMGVYLLNTLKVALLGVTGVVITSALCGYGFARLRAPGLNILFGICLATMMLPSQVTIIPLFLVFSKIGWIDTHFPLWVPAWFGGGAWNIFLFRQFFSSIPKELEEAGMLDGANRFTIFWRLVIPNSKAVLDQLFDLRTPLSLTDDDCVLIGRIVAEACALAAAN